MKAWAAGGVTLDHYTGAQYGRDRPTSRWPTWSPGDLVFFGSDIHHVGLYIGNGQMIDAPDTGSFVRVDSIFCIRDLPPRRGSALNYAFGGRSSDVARRSRLAG